MEPNQQNINMLTYSFSSSSSGNFSKNSEKMNSKKSILRKEGSTSKNKDKHPVFVESLNEVAFYVPDAHNQNQNHRISLNTVNEESENSRSGSDLMNNLSSNRNSINTEQKMQYINNNNSNNQNNINIYLKNNNDLNYEYNNNQQINNVNNINNQYNNIQQNNFYNNINNQYNNQNNNNQYNNQQNVLSDKNNVEINDKNTNLIKNKNIKKPKSRKTLDSAYYIGDFKQNKEINIHQVIINETDKNDNKENKKEISRNFVEIRLSDTGTNPFKSENNLINLSQNNQQLNNSNNTNNSNTSNNSTNEKIEEQTKINTEVNKTLFNTNNQNNNLNINSSLLSHTNNNITSTNTINNNSNQINNNNNNQLINNQINNNINETKVIPKNIKKPILSKRITIGGEIDYNNIINNNNTNNINNLNNNINNINNNNNNYDNQINTFNNINTINNYNKNINSNINNLVNTNITDLNNFNTNFNNISNNNNLNINPNSNNNLNINQNDNNLNINQNNNILNNNISNNNISNINNENKKIVLNKEKKKPKKNSKRITMAIVSPNEEYNFNDNNTEKPKEEQKENNYEIKNNNNINQVHLNKDYKQIIIEEPIYKDPTIKAEDKHINYEKYEKYLQFDKFNYPLSEKKFVIDTENKDKFNNNNNLSSLSVKKINLNDTLLKNLESFNNYNSNRFKLNLNSSPLIELISGKTNKDILDEINLPKRDKYELSFNLNDNENIDMEKEINNQIQFIYKDLEEKEKIWREKNKQNADRHHKFETELNANGNELNNITNKTNEINNQLYDIKLYQEKFNKMSEKGKKLYDSFIESGIDIKDIEHIYYKEMNCLLFTVMVKNYLVYKFIVSDNLWYDQNMSKDTEMTFIGVVYTEIFTDIFSEMAIINKDKNTNLLIQKYFNETIKKIFPNEFESITFNKLCHKYYLSTQISLCFMHILNMLICISSLEEDFSFNSEDLKKYTVKFSYFTIFGAKIYFEYILNIENPFSGNYLNSVEIDKNEFIFNNFDEYRKKKINFIWKNLNPKDIQINKQFFYNVYLILGYVDKNEIYKKEIDNDYVFKVMQGDIIPNEDEDDYSLIDKNVIFDSQEIIKQLKNFYEQDINENNNNYNNDVNYSVEKIEEDFNKDNNNNDDEEIILDLPSSQEIDEKENDKN